MYRRSKGLTVVLWCLTGIVFAGILIAGWQIFLQLKDYQQSNQLYEHLADTYATQESNHSEDENGIGKDANQSNINGKRRQIQSTGSSDSISQKEEWDVRLQVDLNALKSMNPDVMGWILVEGTEISYPLMYASDNDTYLHHAFDGSEATAGSIFIDTYNSPYLTDNHTLIYGHNMRNGSMFGSLDEYASDESYVQDHSYIQVALSSGIFRYQIFAYEVTDTEDPIYYTDFQQEENYEALLNRIQRDSWYDSQESLSTQDRVITLSTCTTGDERFVVHARLVGVKK